MAVFIIFPKFIFPTFQYPLSKRICKRLSGVVAFIIKLYCEYESRVRPCHCAAALHSLTRRADINRAHAFTYMYLGRRYKGVSKQLCVYHLYRNVFLAQTCNRSHFFSAFQTPKPPNQNSFIIMFIICKNHPESRLETLILHQKSDDKRTLWCSWVCIIMTEAFSDISPGTYFYSVVSGCSKKFRNNGLTYS